MRIGTSEEPKPPTGLSRAGRHRLVVDANTCCHPPPVVGSVLERGQPTTRPLAPLPCAGLGGERFPGTTCGVDLLSTILVHMTTNQQHHNDRTARQEMLAAMGSLEHQAPESRDADPEMAGLWSIALLVEHGLVLLDEAVRVCREAGHTWDELAEVLGVTKQGAQQRFGRSASQSAQRARKQSEGQEQLQI